MEQLPLIARRGAVRVLRSGRSAHLQELRKDDLCKSLFAGDGQDRIGPPARSAPNSQATTSTKSFSLARFKNGLSASIDPPRSGSRKTLDATVEFDSCEIDGGDPLNFRSLQRAAPGRPWRSSFARRSFQGGLRVEVDVRKCFLLLFLG
jgi:hypothetical protein